MLTLYFITILTLTTNDISAGWLQWTQPFNNKLKCEFVITQERDQLINGIKGYLKNKFIAVKKMECMTHEEAVKRNHELGHSKGFEAKRDIPFAKFRII